VTSVLSPDALASLTNLKEALGVPASDTSKDNALERVINRTTLFLEGELNRKLKARRYNDGASTFGTGGVPDEDYVYFSGSTFGTGGDTVLDPNGYGLLYLPAYPVRADDETNSVPFVLSVLSARDETGDTWDSAALVANRDYLLDRETGVLRLTGGRFTPGVKNYRVTMCAGYVTAPADLEGLCLEFCKQAYRDSRTLASESIGTWSRTFATAKEDPYVAGLLAKFSRVVL
jgi:hypothetical protein